MGDEGPWYALTVPRWSDDGPAASRQRRARSTRRALLLGAAQYFAEQGYHGSSLREIVTASGHTKGALYFHFTSKRELGEALAAELLASWEDVVARIDARRLDPLQTLLVTYDAWTGRLMYDPLARGGHRVIQDEPSLQIARRRWNVEWEGTVRTLLRRAADAGIIDEDVDLASLAALIFSTAVGHFELSLVHLDGPDMWVRMNGTWLTLLPAIATDRWLERWRESGWAERPAPTAEQYRLCRKP